MTVPSELPLIRRLAPRDPEEPHRVASPLELLTDLCFVVAVSQAAVGLHHALSGHHVGSGVTGFAMSFFAIWWAWLNFTWFGSAYDNDDVVYRLCTLLQILGVLVLAGGIPRVFEGHFGVTVLGYVIMRIGLVLQWLRAARHDPRHRATCRRYALGIVVVQLCWIGFAWISAVDALRVPFFVLFAVLDMLVPVFAERTGQTSWHPHHIAERYSLFFIIVLGETILSATLAVSAAFADAATRGGLVVVVLSSVLVVFGCWWLYFSAEAAGVLAAGRSSARLAFAWGFGHYFVFASAAAVGAGLAVRADWWTAPAETAGRLSGAAVTVPAAVLLASIWSVQLRRADGSRGTAGAFGLAVLLVLAGTWTPLPELCAGLVVAVLLVTRVRAAAQPADATSATSA